MPGPPWIISQSTTPATDLTSPDPRCNGISRRMRPGPAAYTWSFRIRKYLGTPLNRFSALPASTPVLGGTTANRPSSLSRKQLAALQLPRCHLSSWFRVTSNRSTVHVYKKIFNPNLNCSSTFLSEVLNSVKRLRLLRPIHIHGRRCPNTQHGGNQGGGGGCPEEIDQGRAGQDTPNTPAEANRLPTRSTARKAANPVRGIPGLDQVHQ